MSVHGEDSMGEDVNASTWRLIPANGAELEVLVEGTGDPVVFIQTALIADEFQPLAAKLALLGGYRLIRYHRRGYAGSSPVSGPGSVVSDANDCRALLAALGIERVHLVGVSYSGAVALQFARDTPEPVHSLTLLEPPPVHIPSSQEFRAANDRLLSARRARGPTAALDEFLVLVLGPDWRAKTEEFLPGAPAQIQRDASTFLDTDLPALLAWRFGQDDAGHITCPVLHIGGSDSGPWFAEVRELVLKWLPQAEDVVLAGADHSLALTHSGEAAGVLGDFLRRNRIGH